MHEKNPWEALCTIADEIERHRRLASVARSMLVTFAFCARDRHERHGDAEKEAAMVSDYRAMLEELGVMPRC